MVDEPELPLEALALGLPVAEGELPEDEAPVADAEVAEAEELLEDAEDAEAEDEEDADEEDAAEEFWIQTPPATASPVGARLSVAFAAADL